MQKHVYVCVIYGIYPENPGNKRQIIWKLAAALNDLKYEIRTHGDSRKIFLKYLVEI